MMVQNTNASSACTSWDSIDWNIDWNTAQRQVKQLQMRIAKAIRELVIAGSDSWPYKGLSPLQ